MSSEAEPISGSRRDGDTYLLVPLRLLQQVANSQVIDFDILHKLASFLVDFARDGDGLSIAALEASQRGLLNDQVTRQLTYDGWYSVLTAAVLAAISAAIFAARSAAAFSSSSARELFGRSMGLRSRYFPELVSGAGERERSRSAKRDLRGAVVVSAWSKRLLRRGGSSAMLTVDVR